METCVILAVIVGFAARITNSLNTTCPKIQKWKIMDEIEKIRLAGYSSVYFANSSLECLQICNLKDACKSFGIDMVKKDCYLYDFHVWSGSQLDDDGSSLVYSWLFQEFCPAGYIYKQNLNLCFKFYANKANWKTAMNYCNQDGGHLVSADSHDKIQAISQVIGSTDVFLGSTDEQIKGIWRWMNGVIVMSLFDGGFYDGARCMMFQGFFMNFDCLSEQSYVCEIPVFN